MDKELEIVFESQYGSDVIVSGNKPFQVVE